MVVLCATLVSFAFILFLFFFNSSPTTRQTFFDGARWKSCEVRRAESGANHHSGGAWILPEVQRSTDPGFTSHPKSSGPSSEGAFLRHKSARWAVGRRQKRSAGSLDDVRGQGKPSVGAHVWGWSCRGTRLGCGGGHWQCSPQSVHLPNRMGGQLQSSRDNQNWPKS